MGHVLILPNPNDAQFFMDSREKVQKQYRKCEYCDSWYDKVLVKCPNCGAPARMESDE